MSRLGRDFRRERQKESNGLLLDYPLKNTLVPTKGVGSATTSTLIDFEGARRVENLVLTPLATWTRGSAGTGTTPTFTDNYGVAPDGTTTASRLQLNCGAGTSIGDISYAYYSAGAVAQSLTMRTSVWLKSNDGVSHTISIEGGFVNLGIVHVVVDSTWRRFSPVVTTAISVNRRNVITLTGSVKTNGNTADILVWMPQTEDVTGQTNQNPSEGVDGVEYFTILNGNTVSNNVVTEATGAAIPEATLKGARIEVASSNLYANPAILVTQNVTTTAVTHTVSFYGTGTVTFTDTFIGSLVGTGANNRVSLTFTTTAGTLTSTVTGSCLNANCEPKPMATSVMLTTPRNADVLTFPNAGNVSDTAGTVLMDVTPAFDIPSATTAGYGKNWILDLGTDIGLYVENNLLKFTDGSNTATLDWIPLKGVTYKIAAKWSAVGLKVFVNGVAGSLASFDDSINSGANMTIGGSGGDTSYNWGGTIKNLKTYKKALSDTKVVELQKTYLFDENGNPILDENDLQLYSFN